jgi:hypothetical protein
VLNRRTVREAVESRRLTPVMFELGARPHPPQFATAHVEPHFRIGLEALLRGL